MSQNWPPQQPGQGQPYDPYGQGSQQPGGAPQPGQYAPPTQPGQYGQQPQQWPQGAPGYPPTNPPSPYGSAPYPQGYPPTGYGAPQPYGMPPTPQQPARRTGAIIGVIVALVIIVGGAAFALSRNNGGNTTATSSTIYTNALKGTVSGWPTGDGCSPKSDGFHVTADISCFAPTKNLTDFHMTVSASAIGSDTSQPYGVTFHSSEGANQQIGDTYVFLIASDGSWVVAKIIGGDATTLDESSSASSAIKASGVNVIAISMQGKHIVASVNGTQLAAFDDSSVASGQIGLQGSDGSEALFTNLTITK